MADGKQVVWILGAGFSIPLGAPSFESLISWETLDLLKDWAPYIEHRRDGHPSSIACAEAIVAIYKGGLVTNPARSRLWRDPEQFLERLDSAVRDPGYFRDRLNVLVKRLAVNPFVQDGEGQYGFDDEVKAALETLSAEQLRDEAVRFVAGATSRFLERPESDLDFVRDSEAWDPYLRWARLLQPGDTVITFNYDRVLRTLENAASEYHPVHFECPIENSLQDVDGVAECPLHGRVDWELGANQNIAVRDHIVALQDPKKALISTPGRGKKAHSYEALEALWRYAILKLQDAHAIVLVGYRFPPTDNHAKLTLLKAMKDNLLAPIHIVLGPNNDHMRRVTAMLQWTRITPTLVVPHELYAEDFFAAFERDRLFAKRRAK